MQSAVFCVMMPRNLAVDINDSEQIIASNVFCVVKGSRFLRWQPPKQLHGTITRKKSVCIISTLKLTVCSTVNATFIPIFVFVVIHTQQDANNNKIYYKILNHIEV
jgi:hypothetical protein